MYPDPSLPPEDPIELAEQLARYGCVRTPGEEVLERWIVRRGGKIGEVGLQVARYFDPMISKRLWLHAYELHAGDCAWEREGGS